MIFIYIVSWAPHWQQDTIPRLGDVRVFPGATNSTAAYINTY